jgi:hypothetical integral membrane protein (TIGR02206 family)
MRVGSPEYFATLGTMAVVAIGLTLSARRWPGRWVVVANWVLAAVLAGATLSWLTTTFAGQPFSWATSLPLPLCDMATVVTIAALLTRRQWLCEVNYFWGLAGTLQAVLTPDLHAPFPSAEFFEYTLAHTGIVAAAVFLVVGQRIVPRRGAAVRTLGITAAYTAFVGVVDGLTGGDYMFLLHKPDATTLLSVLGPWPWYLVSALGVAIVLLALLDAPWWWLRRREADRQVVVGSGGGRRPFQPLSTSGGG